MRKIKTTIIAILFIIFSVAHADDQDIKIQVGNAVITKLDIDNRIKIINNFNAKPSSDKKNQDKLKEDAINSLIEESLVSDEFKKLKLKIDENEVNYYISNVEKTNNAKSGSFLEDIKKKNISQNSIIEYIKSRIMFSKLANYIIRPTILVSDQEFEEVLASIIPENTEIDFKQIIISADKITNQEEHDKSLEKLNNLRRKITKCAEIENLAAKEKIDVSDMKLSINSLHPEIQNIIRILPIGKSSAIIKSNSGPQIIVVCKRNYNGLNHNEKEEIKEAIIQRKLETQFIHYINKLKRKTFIEIMR